MASDKFFRLAVKFEFNAELRQRFYVKLTQLLGNGVALSVALKQIAGTMETSSKGSVLPRLFRRWNQQVTNGANLGVTMEPYIPAAEAMLIETGANSGRLVDALKNAAEAVEQQGRVRKAIISNGAYPALLMVVLFAAMFLASYQVIPTFADVLPIEEWRGLSKNVAQVSFFFRDWSFLVIGFVALGVFTVAWSMPRWTGKARVKFDYIFPWSIYRMWQGSAFLLSVAALMAAGVKLDEVSLRRISRKADPYLLQRINAIRKGLISGANFGESLHRSGYRFPDDELIADLRIYATLRGFENNLVRITREWVGEIEGKVATAMRVLNVFALVLIAVVIGALIMSLFGVVQQIQTAAQI